RGHADGPISIAKFVHVAGVGPRPLLRASRAVRGAAPYRYLCSLRLLEARRILSSPAGKPPTVTEVATHLGFVELGRFAAAYRSAFGECPSDTLRRSSQSRPESPARATPGSPAIEPRREPKQCVALCGAEE